MWKVLLKLVIWLKMNVVNADIALMAILNSLKILTECTNQFLVLLFFF